MQKFDTIGATYIMSSRPVLVLMALGSFLVFPAAPQNASIADLILRDEIQQAESLLGKQVRTAQNVAFQGEIAFRKGNFDRAEALYREALKMDSRTARAHFGLG